MNFPWIIDEDNCGAPEFPEIKIKKMSTCVEASTLWRRVKLGPYRCVVTVAPDSGITNNTVLFCPRTAETFVAGGGNEGIRFVLEQSNHVYVPRWKRTIIRWLGYDLRDRIPRALHVSDRLIILGEMADD